MTDTITESFCERCGTRYSFEETTTRRRGGFGRVRVLTRGLKNYVANDGMPMDEAMAAAENDEARAGVSLQLEAFHRTFNFCMSCRQYTCANCWNEKVGECLTCAPDLSRDVLPPPFPDLPLGGPAEDGGRSQDDRAVGAGAWPSADLERLTATGATPGAAADTAAIEEPVVLSRLDTFVAAPSGGGAEELTATELAEVETALETALVVGLPASDAPTEPQIEPAAPQPVAPDFAAPVEPAVPAVAAGEEPADAATAHEPAIEIDMATDVESPADAAPPAAGEPAAAAPDDRAAVARGQTRSLLGRFRPGRRPAAGPDDAAGAAAAAARTSQPGPVQIDAAEAAGEPATETRPAPVEAALEPPAEAATRPAPSAEPAEAPAPVDAVEQPTWRVVAPDVAEAPPAAWPDAPAWPASPPQATPSRRASGPAAAPWASRLATARPEPGSVWAASSQEVLAAPGAIAPGRPGMPAVQACVSCGLSLSANARFCRRCGSRQA